ncbi:MAG: hypothetical protein AB1831_09060 [Pseudomonadota bacterium]
MNRLKPAAIACAMLLLGQLPAHAWAEEAPKLETTPATPAAPAPMDDMQAMMPGMGMGMGPGGRCNKRPGMGQGMGQGMMMGGGGMGMGPGGKPCHRNAGACDCGCEGGGDVAARLDEIEKRLDMMQMMLKMMMR